MDCFNILSIDPCEKYISLHRIGSEYDKYGRHIGGLVYNYRERKLIWNNKSATFNTKIWRLGKESPIAILFTLNDIGTK